jgi:hypothetical protein
MATAPRLPLQDMAERHLGLTEAVAAAYLEAAGVCLERHHAPPVEFEIEGANGRSRASADWVKPDDRQAAAWANRDDTTELGAYACALAAVELTEGLFALRRAETRTGADYYVAPVGIEIDDLEDCLRLEVSGVDRGPETVVKQRLKAKLEQARRGASNLPAMAGVVGFGAQVVLTAHVEEQ